MHRHFEYKSPTSVPEEKEGNKKAEGQMMKAREYSTTQLYLTTGSRLSPLHFRATSIVSLNVSLPITASVKHLSVVEILAV